MHQNSHYNGGTRPRTSPHRLSLLELATLIHVATFAIGATWAFGGNAGWARAPLAWWGSLGVLITLAASVDRDARRHGRWQPLKWLWPLLAFNAVVVAGTLNPSFREVFSEGERMYVATGSHPGWPSSALPGRALQALWAFDAIWIAAFNLALVIRQRRALRGLLLVLVTNALVLAVFGTLQKLSGATGLYFNLVPSPQKYFFATFIYHNHWGAFAVLMIAAGIGLTWHYARRVEARDWLHSPVTGGVVAIILITLTIPLSASRSCTLLALLLLGGAFLYWIASLVRRRRRFRESIIPPLAGALGALVLAAAATWWVAGDTLRLRYDKTREQVADIQAQGHFGARAVLYADTWRMAQAKPWFGWGMGSYPHVFTLFNTRESVDRLPVFYRDAHSDWLQAFAEHGFVGSALIAAGALLPVLRLRPRHVNSAIARFLFLGCGLLLLYAWIEFPFGNFAVVLCWWLMFFTAVQYCRLQRDSTSDSASPQPRA